MLSSYFVAGDDDDDGEKKKTRPHPSLSSPSQNSKKKTFQGYLFTYYNTKITEERKAQIERINQQVRDLYGPLLATVNASRTAYKAMVRAHSPLKSGGGGGENGAAAAAFVAAVRRDPEGAEARVYRTWMRDVLQPLNERAAAIVVDVSFFVFSFFFFFSREEEKNSSKNKKLGKKLAKKQKKNKPAKKHKKKKKKKKLKQHADLLESSHMPALLLQLVAHVSANRVVLSRWAQGESGAASAIAYPDALPEWASAQFRGIKARQALLLGVKGSFSGGSEEQEIEGQFDYDDDDEGRAGGGLLAPPPLPVVRGEMEEGSWAEPQPLSSKL